MSADYPKPTCCPFCLHTAPKRLPHGYNVQGGGWDEQREESKEEFVGVGFKCTNPECNKFFLAEH